MDLTILSLNSCFYNIECCIEWKRLIEALIKHYKAQKERSNLSSIGSDIQPHEEAQKKRNISVLIQELKRYRWNIEIYSEWKHLIHRWLFYYLWNTVLRFLKCVHLYLCFSLFIEKLEKTLWLKINGFDIWMLACSFRLNRSLWEVMWAIEDFPQHTGLLQCQTAFICTYSGINPWMHTARLKLSVLIIM